jgi:hypothetical protein
VGIMTGEPDGNWWSSRRTDAKAPGAVRLGLWISLSALSWLVAFCIFRYVSTK